MAANDNVVSCTNSEITFWELLSGAIGVDAQGKQYVRLYATTNVAGSKAFDCTNQVGGMGPGDFRGIFTLDANGDWAIRTGTAT